MNERVTGDALLDAEDLISEIEDLAEISSNGYVTLYHRTTEENVKKIMDTGKMSAKEDGIFFSTKKNSIYTDGYGDSVVKFKIPVEKLVLDDIFDDEAHLRLLLKNRNQVLDVSDYLENSNIGDQQNATKIKSETDNIGTFDGNNPDIRYSLSNNNNAVKTKGWCGTFLSDSLLKENAVFSKFSVAFFWFCGTLFSKELESCPEPLNSREFTWTLPTLCVFPLVAYRITLPSLAFAISTVIL